jgi:hypothetical protein
MALRENLAVHFNTAEFADSAVLTPLAGGDPLSFSVLLDNDHESRSLGDIAQAGRDWVAFALVSEIPGVAVGDTITVNAVDYRVATVEPDGRGVVRMVLHL